MPGSATDVPRLSESRRKSSAGSVTSPAAGFVVDAFGPRFDSNDRGACAICAAVDVRAL
jgi:hypothetical protein